MKIFSCPPLLSVEEYMPDDHTACLVFTEKHSAIAYYTIEEGFHDYSANGIKMYRDGYLEIIDQDKILYWTDLDSVHSYATQCLVMDDADMCGHCGFSFKDYYGGINYVFNGGKNVYLCQKCCVLWHEEEQKLKDEFFK